MEVVYRGKNNCKNSPDLAFSFSDQRIVKKQAYDGAIIQIQSNLSIAGMLYSGHLVIANTI